MMMLALGLFVFQLQTLPYSTLSRNVNYRWASNGRIGLRPAQQFLGQGNETISLNGVLCPEINGKFSKLSLSALELMAGTGRAWPLIEGSGTIYGMYVVESLQHTNTEFFSDGSAKRIEFSINLTRVDESLIAMFGDLSQQATDLYNQQITPAIASAKAAIGGVFS
ncbi:P2 GpU family protein [Dickeya chrysanthemi Ech1591]|uniref:P2 GpU family protein n=3 Tax=Pectobacteriaceae TaxID=1903410 RepID=D2BYG9_DICZ5|nr:P2 GpU family protein [Dickeya chrysanthemi Ech1591]ACZ76637.1 P2 GpU family protein [Dickeya parazeae Ech586]TYL41510.1 phage tail protein [Dickeya sp. ws52]